MSILLKSRTTYSLLQAIPSPEDLINKCKEYGYKSVAITELGNLFSSVKFFQKCQEKEIKPIIGCDLYIKDNDNIATITVLAKNLDGWKTLISLVSLANQNYDLNNNLPLITLDNLNNLVIPNSSIAYIGSIYSLIGKLVFVDYNKAIYSESYEEAKSLVQGNWEKNICDKISDLQNIFGKENFFLEVQTCENQTIPACNIVSKIVRYIAKKTKILKIPTSKTHYLTKQDAEDHRILVCSDNEATLQNIEQKLLIKKDFDNLTFFKNSNGYLPTIEELEKNYEKDEVNNLNKIDEMIEKYNILNQPQVPRFDCPNNILSIEYIKELCRKGWSQKIKNKIDKSQQDIYIDRIKQEFQVINSVSSLPDYLLVVQDIVNWAKSQNWLMNRCRGSVGGSLVAYLLNITNVDPIKNKLLFERFYNAGRNTATRIRLPDIDCDFPINKRKYVIEYIINKYGKNKVSHISTFSGMKGRSALKDVLRAKQRCSFFEMNKITESIPDEAKIQDELQKMKEEEEEKGIKSSIIKWALKNKTKALKPYCYIDEKGELQGEYSIDFAQAIRIEGTKRNRGKHAGGIVISQNPLANGCPMCYDKNNNELICGLDMKDIEALGYLKMDILGVAALDDLMNMIHIVKTGKSYES